jgi:multidrug resistance efflux pump
VDVARRIPASSKKWRALAAAVAAFAVIGTIAALVHPPVAAARTVERSATWTEKVRRGDLVREVPVQGMLVPEHVQWLSAESAGRVAKLPVLRGATVEPDTVVVALANTDLELAALDAERQAASAEARLVDLEVKGTIDDQSHAASIASLRVDLGEADRHALVADRLAPNGLMSDNERSDAVARAAGLADRFQTEEGSRKVAAQGIARQIAAQRGEVDRLREIAAFRRRQLAALEIRAGVHGTVSDLPLENGQWVAIGALLAKVAQPDHLKAEVKVAEAYARDVRPGLSVRFDGTGMVCRGKVARIDPAVTAGSVRVDVTLDEPLPAGARVDQAVSGYVEIERIENALFVARPAGAREGAPAEVFRLEADRSFASRVSARFGRGSAREVEVLGGLAEGDEIVVSDVTKWESAARVRLN